MLQNKIQFHFSGIDVDKFDYLRRDTRQVFTDGPLFDPTRLVEFARVVFTEDGVGQICFPHKVREVSRNMILFNNLMLLGLCEYFLWLVP